MESSEFLKSGTGEYLTAFSPGLSPGRSRYAALACWRLAHIGWRTPTSRNANIETQCLCGFQTCHFGSPNRLHKPITAAHHIPA